MRVFEPAHDNNRAAHVFHIWNPASLRQGQPILPNVSPRDLCKPKQIASISNKHRTASDGHKKGALKITN